ncbi:MAG: serine protease, partial [Chlamydiia bacterium]|nr:serine protease [Chlamydiia bacterium]
LRLNTPGGEVFASQKISDALKEFDTQENIPVVAFIDNWAISAGAMLAYSCRFIAVVKDGSMGAAEPIIQGGQEGTKVASEKINSALRTDFANRAHFFDRNPLIAEAMVDKEIILVERHGEIVKLDTESQIRREGPYPDLLISAKDKLLTLDSEKLIHYGVADLLVPPTPLQSVSDRENEAGKWPASKEALFHYPPFDDLKGATIDSFQMDWRLSFLAILAHPAVASVLFLGLLMGAYMEMSTPGFGLPGGVALLCLFLIILSNFALEAENILELLFIAAGIALLLLEVFVLPGFGICGIAGILLLFAGILGVMLPEFSQLEYNPDTGNWNAAMDHFLERLSWLSGSFILAVILMILWGRGVARHPQLFSHLVLAGGEEESSKGYSAAGEGEDSLKVGDEGVVVAALRPTGKITVNDRTYTAVSQGEFIEEGIQVVVAAIEGAKISVTRSLQE